MIDAHDYLRLAVEPVRLAVLGSAVGGPVDATALADHLRVPTREVQAAIGRLREAGLLTTDGSIDRRTLRAIAMTLPRDPAIDPELIADGWSQDEATVLSRFFSGRRLTEIPTSRAKRRVVLDRLVQEFEPGLRYREKEVNFTLQMFHADYAALRRYLVDEGFLTRADGVYWRTGGRI
jgi:hypothetical protein